MYSRGYFILGAKLLGIWCLFMGVVHLGAAVTSFVDIPNLGEEYAKIMVLTRIVIRIIPIVYFLIGFYLVKDGTILHNLAYPAESEDNHDFGIKEKFVLFIKLLGVYLIVSHFPDLLKSVTSYLTYSNTSDIFNLLSEKQYSMVHFLLS